MFFSSFTTAPTASNSAETSFHLPLGFACSHASWKLCPPLLPAGCSFLVFMVPYKSLLFHLSLFSVMALSTNVVFSTLDSLFLLRDEHEDVRVTLCTVPELKEAASTDTSKHSSHFFCVHHHQRMRVECSLSCHPSFHLLAHSSTSRTLPTVVNMHDLGVCVPLQKVVQQRP